MKKIFFSIVFVIALMVSLSACKAKPDEGNAGESGMQPDQFQPDQHVCAPGEPETNVLEEPTCEYEGEAEVITVCTECGNTIEYKTITLDKLPHTPGEVEERWDQETTCYQDGVYYEVISCIDCYVTISETRKTEPKTSDHWEMTKEENRIEPTCTVDGSYELVTYCNYNGCGEELSRETKTLEMIDHTPANPVNENVVEATCTEEGSHDEVKYCKDCDVELSRTKVIDSATGHSSGTAVKENEISNTCFEDGSYDSVVYCETCSQELTKTQKIIKAAHQNDEYGICIICDPNASRGLEYSGNSIIGIGTCTDTDLVIPKYYKGRIIKRIGNAFGNYHPGVHFTGIEFNSVTIPDSITSIAEYAFVKSINNLYINMDVAQWCQIEWLEHLTSGKNGNPIICAKNIYFNGELLTELIIPEGVTEIKMATFKGLNSLERVVIPDSVTTIGDFAFNDCANLRSVTLGKNVTYIGYRAFCCAIEPNLPTWYPVLEVVNHSSLDISVGSSGYGEIAINAVEVHNGEAGVIKTVGDFVFIECGNGNNYIIEYVGSETELVTLPKNYNGGDYGIANFAFSNCYADSIVIPSAVNKICGFALNWGKVRNIYYSSDIADWCEIEILWEYFDGKYYSAIGNGASFYINGELVTDLVIPGKATTVSDRAFYYYDYLTSVVISDGVVSIGKKVFCGCDSLSSVIISDTVTHIGVGAFYLCSNLSFNEYDNAYYLGTKDNPYYALIEAKSTDITSCTVHSDTVIIADSAFSGCSDLTSVVIGNKVTNIGESAFSHCYKLVEVINRSSLDVELGSENYGGLAYYAKEVHTGYSKIINTNNYLFCTYDGVNYLLGYVGSGRDLVLPENYNGENYAIYDYAFNNLSINSIVISNGVSAIGDYSFNGIRFPYGSAFELEIPNSVISIGDFAFTSTHNLYSITIPESVTKIGLGAFNRGIGGGIYIRVNENNTAYKSDYGTLYTIDGKTLVHYYGGSYGSFDIPEGVTVIGAYAFYGITNSVHNITLSDTVTTIEDYAFASMYSAIYEIRIYIPDSVTTISDSAFKGTEVIICEI